MRVLESGLGIPRNCVDRENGRYRSLSALRHKKGGLMWNVLKSREIEMMAELDLNHRVFNTFNGRFKSSKTETSID